MQKTPIIKGICALAVVGTLIAASLGCQSRRFYRAQNTVPAGPAATYEGSSFSPGTYSQPATTVPMSSSPSRGCGPGCKSCGNRAIPALAGPQMLAPDSDSAPRSRQ